MVTSEFKARQVRAKTNEVREVPVEPPKPQPITCPFCGKSYIPADNQFTCLSCGAPAPKELIEQSAASSGESH